MARINDKLSSSPTSKEYKNKDNKKQRYDHDQSQSDGLTSQREVYVWFLPNSQEGERHSPSVGGLKMDVQKSGLDDKKKKSMEGYFAEIFAGSDSKVCKALIILYFLNEFKEGWPRRRIYYCNNNDISIIRSIKLTCSTNENKSLE